MEQHQRSRFQFFFPIVENRRPLGFVELRARTHDTSEYAEQWEPLPGARFSLRAVDQAVGHLFPNCKSGDLLDWRPVKLDQDGESYERWRGASANLASFLVIIDSQRSLRLRRKHIWASGAFDVERSGVVRYPNGLWAKLDVWLDQCKAHDTRGDALLLLPRAVEDELSKWLLEQRDVVALTWPADADIKELRALRTTTTTWGGLWARLVRPWQVKPACEGKACVVLFPEEQLGEFVCWLQGGAKRRRSPWLFRLALLLLMYALGALFLMSSQSVCRQTLRPLNLFIPAQSSRVAWRIGVTSTCATLCQEKCRWMRKSGVLHQKGCLSHCQHTRLSHLCRDWTHAKTYFSPQVPYARELQVQMCRARLQGRASEEISMLGSNLKRRPSAKVSLHARRVLWRFCKRVRRSREQ